MYSQVVHQASGIRRFWFGVSLQSPLRPILRSGNRSLNSLEMPLLASAFPNILPHVTCGQPAGRERATQLVSNCRGARLMGIRNQGSPCIIPLLWCLLAKSRTVIIAVAASSSVVQILHQRSQTVGLLSFESSRKASGECGPVAWSRIATVDLGHREHLK